MNQCRAIILDKKGGMQMRDRKVFIHDNFFSSGYTDIRDEGGRKVGSLDLQGMFSSGVTVLDENGAKAAGGKFRFFSNAWEIVDAAGFELGVLKARFSFFSKRFEYRSAHSGSFTIESPAFSGEYRITGSDGAAAAHFRKTSGPFSAGSFELDNRSGLLTEELIVLVMGVHAIQKRQHSAAT